MWSGIWKVACGFGREDDMSRFVNGATGGGNGSRQPDHIFSSGSADYILQNDVIRGAYCIDWGGSAAEEMVRLVGAL